MSDGWHSDDDGPRWSDIPRGCWVVPLWIVIILIVRCGCAGILGM